MITYWLHKEPDEPDALLKFDTATCAGYVWSAKQKAWVDATDFVNNVVTGWEKGGVRITQDQAEELSG